MLRAGSFMVLLRRIWNQRLVRSDIERMPRVAAPGHPEADQVRALSKHVSRDERPTIAGAIRGLFSAASNIALPPQVPQNV
jgi:hypothetical protein